MENTLVVSSVRELQEIEQSKAAQIAQAFTPMSTLLADFEENFNKIISESENGITEDLTKKAKRLRLDIGKIRIETGKIKDKQKEDIKLLDKAIMGVHNFLVLAVKEKEDKLSEIEKHFERIQAEKRAALQKERVELISEYLTDASTRDLAGMDELVWDAFFTTCRRNHEERLAAEAKAEAERIENARLDKLERDRREIILPYRQFWTCDNYNLREMSETNFNTICTDLKRFKAEFDAENERIRIENERKEKELAEERRKAEEERKLFEAERKIAEEKARKEREEIERKAEEDRHRAREEAERIERERQEERRIASEKQARIEAELKAKKDAEEAARKAMEEAERKAARAPDKDKIASYIAAIENVPVPEVKSVEAGKILVYALKQINQLVETLKQQNDRM